MENLYLQVNQEPKAFQSILEKLPQSDGGGIYKLYYFKDDKPRVVQRLFAEDTAGILYIGMTEGPLNKRVKDLQIALIKNSNHDLDEPESSGHTQMGLKFFRIRRHIDINNLFIKVFPEAYPKERESEQIDSYVRKYGELPPLNGQYGSIAPDWKSF
jgi:hypothetical protein